MVAGIGAIDHGAVVTEKPWYEHVTGHRGERVTPGRIAQVALGRDLISEPGRQGGPSGQLLSP